MSEVQEILAIGMDNLKAKILDARNPQLKQQLESNTTLYNSDKHKYLNDIATEAENAAYRNDLTSSKHNIPSTSAKMEGIF